MRGFGKSSGNHNIFLHYVAHIPHICTKVCMYFHIHIHSMYVQCLYVRINKNKFIIIYSVSLHDSLQNKDLCLLFFISPDCLAW